MGQPIYWATTALLAVATILAVVALSLAPLSGGLTSDERIELNILRNNISILQVESEMLLDSTVPLQQAIDNTSDTIELNKRRDVPRLQQCQDLLNEFFPLIVGRSEELNNELMGFDLTRLNVLQPLLDSAEMTVSALAASFQYTGIIQTLQSGTFYMANFDEPTELTNMTYNFKEMQLPGGARLYFIHVPPNPDNLLIQTVDGTGVAAVVFTGWYPPLPLGQGLSQTSHTDPILDQQRAKLQVTPTPIIFKERTYDLGNDQIIIRDTSRNFTVGDVVRVLQDIEMNVGYL